MQNPGILGMWGPGSARVVAVESYWNSAFALDRKAAKEGRRIKVFSLSLGDWLEQHDGPLHRAAQVKKGFGPRLGINVLDGTWGEWAPDDLGDADWRPLTLDDCRLRMLDTIRQTPNLDWQLLTKRPGEWRSTIRRVADLCEGRPSSQCWDLLKWLIDWFHGYPPANVWVGASVGHQAAADEMVPKLLLIPAAFRWLSVEPLIGPVDILKHVGTIRERSFTSGVHGHLRRITAPPKIGWVVIGGESGPNARPCDLAWIRSIRNQCQAAEVPCFVKQLGAVSVGCNGNPDDIESYGRTVYRDPKGGDIDEFPEDLRVREFPRRP